MLSTALNNPENNRGQFQIEYWYTIQFSLKLWKFKNASNPWDPAHLLAYIWLQWRQVQTIIILTLLTIYLLVLLFFFVLLINDWLFQEICL